MGGRGLRRDRIWEVAGVSGIFEVMQVDREVEVCGLDGSGVCVYFFNFKAWIKSSLFVSVA